MDAIKMEKWAPDMTKLLEGSLVGAAVGNLNVVVNGAMAKCHIVGAGDVTVFDVDDDTDIEYQDVTDTDTEFEWNLDKGFGILIKDADKAQTEIDFAPIYSARGAYGLKKALDTAFLANYASAGLDSYETGTTAWQIGAAGADVPALFASILRQLEDAEMQDGAQPYLVAPPILIQGIRLYAASKNTSWGDSVTLNGMVDKFMGVDVYRSTNLTTSGGVIHALAGVTGDNIAMKTLIAPESMEQMRAQGRWGTLVRGRCKAGTKVYRSDTLIDVNLNETLLA